MLCGATEGSVWVHMEVEGTNGNVDKNLSHSFQGRNVLWDKQAWDWLVCIISVDSGAWVLTIIICTWPSGDQVR